MARILLGRHVAHLRPDGKGLRAGQGAWSVGPDEKRALPVEAPREGVGEVPPGSPRGRQGLRWTSAPRSRSLVARDEIHPHEDVPRQGLQEVRFAPARWHGEGGVQSVQPEEVQMGRSWGWAGAAIADFAEVIQ